MAKEIKKKVPVKEEGVSDKPYTPKILSPAEIFAEERCVFITRAIDQDTSDQIVTQLVYLYNIDCYKPITVYINCPGGSVPHGLAIISMMKQFRGAVRTVCLGMACSMASVILAAGTKGWRFISEDADFVMMHQVRGGMWGKTTDVTIAHDMIIRTNEKLARMLSKYTGQSFEKIMADWKDDLWLDPAQAKDYGFVDDVITEDAGLKYLNRQVPVLNQKQH